MPGPPPGAAVLVALADVEAPLDEDEEVAAELEAGLAAGAELLEDDAAGVEALDELGLDDEPDELELLELAANQVSTPWWPLHAPFLVGAVVNVPSLHLPVAPAGGA
jgi:anti-sigma factor RsiW